MVSVKIYQKEKQTLLQGEFNNIFTAHNGSSGYNCTIGSPCEINEELQQGMAHLQQPESSDREEDDVDAYLQSSFSYKKGDVLRVVAITTDTSYARLKICKLENGEYVPVHIIEDIAKATEGTHGGVTNYTASGQIEHHIVLNDDYNGLYFLMDYDYAYTDVFVMGYIMTRVVDSIIPQFSDVLITSSAEREEEMMKSCHTALSWRDKISDIIPADSFIIPDENDIDFRTGEPLQWSLLEPYEPEQKNDKEFVYTPKFQHPKMYLGKVVFTTKGKDDYGNDVDNMVWPYTGSLYSLLEYFCTAINAALGIDTKKISGFSFVIMGEVQNSVTVSFSAQDIISALNNVANVCGCEWHLDWESRCLYFGKEIKIKRNEHQTTPRLKVGMNIGISSNKSSKEGFWNAFMPQGSNRNVTRAVDSGEFVQARARVALNNNREHVFHQSDGTEVYMTTPDGLVYTDEQGHIISKEDFEDSGKRKFIKSVIFDDIYPHLDLYVYDVRKRELYLTEDGSKDGEWVKDEINGGYKTFDVWYIKLARPITSDGNVIQWKPYILNDEIKAKIEEVARTPNGKNYYRPYPQTVYAGATYEGDFVSYYIPLSTTETTIYDELHRLLSDRKPSGSKQTAFKMMIRVNLKEKSFETEAYFDTCNGYPSPTDHYQHDARGMIFFGTKYTYGEYEDKAVKWRYDSSDPWNYAFFEGDHEVREAKGNAFIEEIHDEGGQAIWAGWDEAAKVYAESDFRNECRKAWESIANKNPMFIEILSIEGLSVNEIPEELHYPPTIDGKNAYIAFQPNFYSRDMGDGHYKYAESTPLAGRGSGDGNGHYGFKVRQYTDQASCDEARQVYGNDVKREVSQLPRIEIGDYEIFYETDNDYIIPTKETQGIIPKGGKQDDGTTPLTTIEEVTVGDKTITRFAGIENQNDGLCGNRINFYNVRATPEMEEGAEQEVASAISDYIKKIYTDNDSKTFKSNASRFKASNPDLYIGKPVTYVSPNNVELPTRVMKLVTKLDIPYEQEITVGNEILKSNQQKLQDSVATVIGAGYGGMGGSAIGGVTSSQVQTMIEDYCNSNYLSKTHDDTAQGVMKFSKGFTIGSYGVDYLGSATLNVVSAHNMIINGEQVATENYVIRNFLSPLYVDELPALSDANGSLYCVPSKKGTINESYDKYMRMNVYKVNINNVWYKEVKRGTAKGWYDGTSIENTTIGDIYLGTDSMDYPLYIVTDDGLEGMNAETGWEYSVANGGGTYIYNGDIFVTSRWINVNTLQRVGSYDWEMVGEKPDLLAFAKRDWVRQNFATMSWVTLQNYITQSFAESTLMTKYTDQDGLWGYKRWTANSQGQLVATGNISVLIAHNKIEFVGRRMITESETGTTATHKLAADYYGLKLNNEYIATQPWVQALGYITQSWAEENLLTKHGNQSGIWGYKRFTANESGATPAFGNRTVEIANTGITFVVAPSLIQQQPPTYILAGGNEGLTINNGTTSEVIATRSWVGEQGYTTNVGTVTSVGLSVPTGLSVSGSPITSNGTLAISFASGYSIPTTAKQGQWDAAYSSSHTHSNKSVLDGITATLVQQWNSAYTNSHTHSNKSVLDGITSTKVSNWDAAYGWGNHAAAGYALSSELANYLPLSGGTLSGDLVVGSLSNYGEISNNSITAYGSFIAHGGNSTYITTLKSGGVQFKNGVGTALMQLLITGTYQGRIGVGSEAFAYVSEIPSAYVLPLAANGTRGGIQIGYQQSGKNYPVQLSGEKAYVNVPWTDTVYTLPQATENALGGIKVGFLGRLGTKKYAVALDDSGNAYVSVPWENTNTAALLVRNTSERKIGTTESPSAYLQFTGGTNKFTITDGTNSFDVVINSSGKVTSVVGEIGDVTASQIGDALRQAGYALTDTHYTAKNVVGNVNSQSNTTIATNGSLYLNLIENSAIRSALNIVGSDGVQVTSPTAGKIQIGLNTSGLSVGNADTLDGYHASAFAQAAYDTIEYIEDGRIQFSGKSVEDIILNLNHTHAYSDLTGIPKSKGNSTTPIYIDANGDFQNVNMSGYATTSALGNYLPLSGGTITGGLTVKGAQWFYGLSNVCDKAADASYMNSAIQVREYNFGGTQTAAWGYAPRLSWHWSGRVQAQIGLWTDGHLYISEDGSFSTPRLIIHSGNIGSQSVNYATSAGNSNNADKLDGYHGKDYLNFDYTAADITFEPTTRKFACTRTSAGWNSEAKSTIGFKECRVTFKIGQTNKNIMVGLNSDPNTSGNYQSIDYALYCYESGTINIYESGTSQGMSRSYSANDEFAIEYSDGFVKYYHNSVLIRSVARSYGTPLYMDSSFYHNGYIYDVYFEPIRISDRLYSDERTVSQTVDWLKDLTKDVKRGFIYNTSGIEYSYLLGFKKNAIGTQAVYGAALKMGYQDNYLRILRVNGGSWITSDWEKISAGYADTAGSATTASSATYATSAGNADKVDGFHVFYTDFLYSYNKMGMLEQSAMSGDFWYAKIVLERGYDPSKSAIVLKCSYSNIQGEVYLNLLSYAYGFNAYVTDYNGCNIVGIRKYWENTKSVIYLKLKKPTGSYNGYIYYYGGYDATITVSATDLLGNGLTYFTLEAGKTYGVMANTLATSRTLWGQSFDGSANVSGAMSGVTNIDSLLYFDTTNSRIGIGNRAPAYTLDVNGTLNASGNITQNGVGVLTVDGGTLNANKTLTFTNDSASALQQHTLTINSNGISVDIEPLVMGALGKVFATNGTRISYGTAASMLAYSNGTVCINLNADLLDGKHASNFVQITNGAISGISSIDSLLNFDTTNSKIYISGSNTQVSMNGSGLEVAMTLADRTCIEHDGLSYRSYGDMLIKRLKFDDTDSYKLKIETELSGETTTSEIITSDTIGSQSVASAATLTTSRTIWGQSFNGSGNITGDLSGVNHIVPSANITYSVGSSTRNFEAVFTRQVISYGTSPACHVGSSASSRISLHWAGNNDRGLFDYANSTGKWLIATDGTNTRMMFGNVGIGVASPTHKLEVDGTAKVTRLGINNDVNTNYRLYCNGNVYMKYSTDTYMTFYTPAQNVECIKLNAKNSIDCNCAINATSFNRTSDERKKDVQDYLGDISIKDIAQAPAIRFKWRDGNDKSLQRGTLAQYWQSVTPECVIQGYDGYLSLQYDVIALLAAISVARKVQDHELRIKQLEDENRQLRKQLGM